ncbi:hypothetical protein OG863_34555 [Streptomyces decoyicus]|uniref:Uncharacterized protein n=1 Tax=Streptomyces decoyicus TaxID=249567 RepID=A0ABZ1FRV4_9ACTN|nr:hypothetical protein [Streptomyces decoyicus]WSB72664.1 hypothetical protein OG863_34555 [Streptomyces decoyicus]
MRNRLGALLLAGVAPYAAGRMVRERFRTKDVAAAPGLRVLHIRP